MYYILYEGLKIESNEPVYCTVYIVHCICVHCTMYMSTLYTVYLSIIHCIYEYCTLYICTIYTVYVYIVHCISVLFNSII